MNFLSQGYREIKKKGEEREMYDIKKNIYIYILTAVLCSTEVLSEISTVNILGGFLLLAWCFYPLANGRNSRYLVMIIGSGQNVPCLIKGGMSFLGMQNVLFLLSTNLIRKMRDLYVSLMPTPSDGL